MNEVEETQSAMRDVQILENVLKFLQNCVEGHYLEL